MEKTSILFFINGPVPCFELARTETDNLGFVTMPEFNDAEYINFPQDKGHWGL